MKDYLGWTTVHNGRLFTMRDCLRWKTVHDKRLCTMKDCSRWGLLKMKDCSRWKTVQDIRLFKMKHCSRWKTARGERLFTMKLCSIWKTVYDENCSRWKTVNDETLFTMKDCSRCQSIDTAHNVKLPIIRSFSRRKTINFKKLFIPKHLQLLKVVYDEKLPTMKDSSLLKMLTHKTSSHYIYDKGILNFRECLCWRTRLLPIISTTRECWMLEIPTTRECLMLDNALCKSMLKVREC